MTKNQFVFRLLFVLLAICFFIVIMILLLLFPVAKVPNPFDLIVVSIVVTAPLLAIWLIVVYYTLARPLALFLEDAEKGLIPEGPRLTALQNRAVNLPNLLGLAGMPPYIIGVPMAAYIYVYQLHLEHEFILLGYIAGGLAAINALVMHSFFGQWVTGPVLKLLAEGSGDDWACRTAGLWIPVRLKLIATIIALVVTTTGFVSLVRYMQLHQAVDNMERLEALLPEPVKVRLREAELKRAPLSTNLEPQSARSFQKNIATSNFSNLLLIMTSMLLTVALSASAASSITRPLSTLGRSALKVMRGEYDEPVRLLTNDELSGLGASVNRMLTTITAQIQGMEGMLDNLRQGVQQMDQTAGVMIEVSEEQSSGAMEQASAVAETSSIAQEILSTAKQISLHAADVDQEARGTLEACRAGEKKLTQAHEGFLGIREKVEAIRLALEELEKRFRHTFKIVELIQEIAEQTELLGLNASLEAAGAGVYGRRFEVVAEATGKLAGRTLAAAREIKIIVASIQEATLACTRIAQEGKDSVEHGGQAMDSVVRALKAISASAGSTSRVAREITLSTNQQTQGIEQLALSVDQVNQVAQRVEEGARRIESETQILRGFSESMRNIDPQPVGETPAPLPETRRQARESPA